MAGVDQNYSIMDQLAAMFGLGNNGVQGSMETGMTVPTALNTGSGWTPPGGSSGLGAGTGLGFNTQTGQLALGGLSSLAGLFASQKALGLAEDQFDFTKKTTNTNLRNQAQSYNTALEDKINSRAAMEGRDSKYVQDYLTKNRLSS
jgi:hypothetical protein